MPSYMAQATNYAVVPMYYRVVASSNSVDVIGDWGRTTTGDDLYHFESNGVFRVTNGSLPPPGRNGVGAYFISGATVMAIAAETNGTTHCLAGTVEGTNMIVCLKRVSTNGYDSLTGNAVLLTKKP